MILYFGPFCKNPLPSDIPDACDVIRNLLTGVTNNATCQIAQLFFHEKPYHVLSSHLVAIIPKMKTTVAKAPIIAE